jgi:GNAT superfamily N-acetyltransferase
MPRTTDRDDIRSLLETDRIWAAYALGDLAPGFFEKCEWFRARDLPALALLFRGFSTPVLFTLGEAAAVEGLLQEIGSLPATYLSIRPEILPLIRERGSVRDEMAMWRMTIEPGEFRPAPSERCTALTAADCHALQLLYGDGAANREAPDFFEPTMVEHGVFYGVYQGGALIAAAGTHLVAPSLGVGAIGNVYTRRDCRGQGLAARVTGAVTAELLRMGVETVVLNVSQRNEAAIRVYERLGFRRYCGFYEGLSVREMGERIDSTTQNEEKRRC